MIDRNPAYCVATRWGLVDISIPDPDVIRENLLEIIRACSRINRWNGHANIPWSVSAHSVLCTAVAPPELRVAMAAHDLHEAIIGDLSRAWRTVIECVEDLDREWAQASLESIDLHPDNEDRFAIDLIDSAVAATEAKEFGLLFSGMTFSHKPLRLDLVASSNSMIKRPDTKPDWEQLHMMALNSHWCPRTFDIIAIDTFGNGLIFARRQISELIESARQKTE